MSENLPNLTKREIVLEIYEKTGFPQKEVVATVQMTLDIIMRALAEGRNVELRNLASSKCSAASRALVAIRTSRRPRWSFRSVRW